MFKKLIIALSFIAPLCASEEVSQPAQEAAFEESQQTLSESIVLMIKDLERMINYIHIVKNSSYNIDKNASSQRIKLIVLTKMHKLADAGISIEEVARFNEVYKAFQQMLRETYKDQTGAADTQEDAVNTEAESDTL